MSYWQNYTKFFVSFQKAMWGAAATPENNFAYDYLPKLDVPGYDMLRAFELMHQGKMNGYFCQGFNPLLSFPNTQEDARRRSRKLKFLVIMDPLETETSRFWENHGEFNDVDPPKIQTEVIQLPVDLLCRGRGLACQLGPLAAMALGGRHASRRGEDRQLDHGADLSAAEGALPEGGRRVPRSDPQPALALQGSGHPQPEELAKEINGYALADVTDPNDPTKVLRREGQAGRRLRACCATTATTACGCWIYSGCFTEAGNKMARRDNSRSRRHRRLSRTGRGRGRPTGASSTTALPPTSTASRGIRAAS